MHNILHDPALMREVVRRCALRALPTALHKLARVARGVEQFENDHQLRACALLARLAPVLVAGRDAEQIQAEDAEPLDVEESFDRRLAAAQMRWLQSLTPEQRKEFAADREARIKAWEAQRPRFTSPEQVAAYYKTHKLVHISEVEEEGFPEHLRRENFMREEAQREQAR